MKSFFSTALISDPKSALVGGGAPPDSTGRHEGPWGYGSADFDMRVRRARLGLVVGLIGSLMIFISFTSAYVVRQGLPTLDPRTMSLVHDWLPVPLPGLLLINTFLLLVSSGAMELARRQLARKTAQSTAAADNGVWPTQQQGIPWLAFTIVLGLSFLAGQWAVWRELAAAGFYISANPSSSFFFLLTGTHGVHLLGGIFALLVAAAASILRRPAESRLVILDVTGWYWHFMAVLWVCILCLLEFSR